MATDIVMPQMGESIAEGTITRWLKQVGDRVERDEPLFEISTDKVDAEIPSPAAGTLTEIKFKEGETVEVNKVVAVLDGNGAAPTAGSTAAAATLPAPPEASQAIQAEAETEVVEPAPEPAEEVAAPAAEAEPIAPAPASAAVPEPPRAQPPRRE